jgi:hypothetical protein
MDCEGLVELAARALHILESFCIHLYRAGGNRWERGERVKCLVVYIGSRFVNTEVSYKSTQRHPTRALREQKYAKVCRIQYYMSMGA